jgi:hypothetical protein
MRAAGQCRKALVALSIGALTFFVTFRAFIFALPVFLDMEVGSVRFALYEGSGALPFAALCAALSALFAFRKLQSRRPS